MPIKQELYRETLLKRKLPLNFKSQDFYLFEPEIRRLIPSLNSFRYKNVSLNNDLFLWRNFKFLKYSFFRREHLENKNKFNNFKFFVHSFFKRKRKINNGLWLIDNWSYGYYHWFSDVLQKYVALNNFYPIIVPKSYSCLNYVIESCDFLDIKLEFIDNNEIMKVKELIVIPTVFKSGNYYEGTIKNLRKRFFNSLKFLENPTKTKILYLSREKTSRRKVINNEKVKKVITQLNGNSIALETLTWVEQLKMISNCKLIISPHGASLTNILFINKGVKVIELRHHNSENQNMYFSLASALDIDYYYIKCNSKVYDSHVGDINVPTDELAKLIKKIL